MTRFVGSRYVLAVLDLDASTRFYTEVLGFEVDSRNPGWTFLCRDACWVMLGECPGEVPAADLGNHSYVGYVNVEGIDAYYAGVEARGAKILKTLRDESWGQREFAVRTIDGHRFMFGETIVPTRLTDP